jgi:hypothetical protein
MPGNDSPPQFVVRWLDKRTRHNFETQSYLVHEEAELHFVDLIADHETLWAQEVQKTRRGDMVLRTWEASAYPTV